MSEIYNTLREKLVSFALVHAEKAADELEVHRFPKGPKDGLRPIFEHPRMSDSTYFARKRRLDDIFQMHHLYVEGLDTALQEVARIEGVKHKPLDERLDLLFAVISYHGRNDTPENVPDLKIVS